MLLGREAIGVELDARAARRSCATSIRRRREAVERVGAKVVFANCAPRRLWRACSRAPQRGAVERAYGGRALSTSLFSAHFGLDAPPAKFGLERYGHDRAAGLDELAARDRRIRDGCSAPIPSGRLPAYGVANYGAIDSGLADGGPTLVSVVGLDRFEQLGGADAAARKGPARALARRVPGRARSRLSRPRRRRSTSACSSTRARCAISSTRPTARSTASRRRRRERGIWAGMPRSPRTPVPGLYLASSFGGSGGFTGAMMSGARSGAHGDARARVARSGRSAASRREPRRRRGSLAVAPVVEHEAMRLGRRPQPGDVARITRDVRRATHDPRRGRDIDLKIDVRRLRRAGGGVRRAGGGREADAAAPVALQRDGDRLGAAVAKDRPRHAAGVIGPRRGRSERRCRQGDESGDQGSRRQAPGHRRHSQYWLPLKLKQCAFDAGSCAFGARLAVVSRCATGLEMHRPVRLRISPRPQALATQRPPVSASPTKHSEGHRRSRLPFKSSRSAALGKIRRGRQLGVLGETGEAAPVAAERPVAVVAGIASEPLQFGLDRLHQARSARRSSASWPVAGVRRRRLSGRTDRFARLGGLLRLGLGVRPWPARPAARAARPRPSAPPRAPPGPAIRGSALSLATRSRSAARLILGLLLFAFLGEGLLQQAVPLQLARRRLLLCDLGAQGGLALLALVVCLGAFGLLRACRPRSAPWPCRRAPPPSAGARLRRRRAWPPGPARAPAPRARSARAQPAPAEARGFRGGLVRLLPRQLLLGPPSGAPAGRAGRAARLRVGRIEAVGIAVEEFVNACRRRRCRECAPRSLGRSPPG